MQEIMKKVNSHFLKVAYHQELLNVLGHLEVTRRLDRAYDILVRSTPGDYTISVTSFGEGPPYFTVKSPNDTYLVNQGKGECNCPDGEKLCKHRLAVKLILTAIRLEKEENRIKSPKP